MEFLIFWFFALLMLAFAAATITLRSPVNSAMSLVASFLCLAAVFVTLNAYFIAVVQVLVYAGAVMVLFLFIIMLLDLKAETTRSVKVLPWAGAGLVAFAFICLLGRVLTADPRMAFTKPDVFLTDDVMAVGAMLFKNFNLPFQVVGALLLVATVGVVLLARKQIK